jgi:DNA-nicking Smr family endonuclease
VQGEVALPPLGTDPQCSPRRTAKHGGLRYTLPMGRRKKRSRPETGAPRSPGGPEPIHHRPFAEALADVAATRPEAAPPARARPEPPKEKPAAPAHGYDDRVAFAQAFADVRPLAPPRRERASRASGSPSPADGVASRPVANPGAEARARARLDALVGGGVRFQIVREEGWVEGLRDGTARSLLRGLRQRGVAPEATLDLHGMTGDGAERAVVRFLREGHRRGVRRVLIVHGRGTHSEGGAGVLGDRVLHALTDGRAAPLVAAFVTAPRALGGEGALLVQLVPK